MKSVTARYNTEHSPPCSEFVWSFNRQCSDIPDWNGSILFFSSSLFFIGAYIYIYRFKEIFCSVSCWFYNVKWYARFP